MKFKTPFADLIPPLQTEEFEALKTDIKQHGVLHAVFVDEADNVLDGHNRLKIDPNAPVKVIDWLKTDNEKRAFVYSWGNRRRNLSPDQKRELRESMKRTAKELRHEAPKKWTLEALSKIFGVSKSLVATWFEEPTRSNSKNGKASKSKKAETPKPKPQPKPDARVKVSESAQEDAYERVKAGEPQSQVAADFGVSQRQVSSWCKKFDRKRSTAKEKAKRSAAGKKLKLEEFQQGDFRAVADTLPDGSVDLIFTDPPYFRKNLDLYRDIAEVGKRVLKPGGSLLCYCGQYLMPDLLAAMTPHLRLWWVCAVRHTGQLARMTEYGIVVHWKPVLWFVNGTRDDKRTFVDDMIAGEREKTEHEWQQSVIEAKHFIDPLCPKGGFVFDPFCGGGTTAIACRDLKRKFVTCDVDDDALNIAKDRYQS